MSVLVRTRYISVFVALLLGLSQPALTDEHRIEGEGTGAFVIEDGKVDPATYEGYLVYTRACAACHGPDGLGSSFAPNLIRAVERRGWENFAGTIAAGREVQPGQVMPSFADDPYVMGNISNLFSYLRARGEGDLGRGRPRIIESMQEEAEQEQGATEAEAEAETETDSGEENNEDEVEE